MRPESHRQPPTVRQGRLAEAGARWARPGFPRTGRGPEPAAQQARPKWMQRAQGFWWSSWQQYGKGNQRGWGQDSRSAITKTGPEK